LSAESWKAERAERDELFAGHPQSAIDPAERAAFGGLRYFDFDPAWRFEVEVEPLPDDCLMELARETTVAAE